MNYLLDRKTVYSNRPRRGGLGPYAAAGAVVLLVMAIIVISGRFVAEPVTDVSAVSRGRSLALLDWSGITSIFSSRNDLLRENARLKEKLRESAVEAAETKMRLEELSALAAVVGREPSTSEAKAVAKVLGPAGFTGYDAFYIDAGEADGIVPGDLVVTGQSVILGEVIRAARSSSLVRLYSTAERTTAVSIGQENIRALAVGQGGGNYLVNLPTSAEVIHNDIARTTRSGREYILGLVGAVEKSEEVPFQKIFIKPPVNIYELRFVSVHGR